MKKTLVILFALCQLFALAACTNLASEPAASTETLTAPVELTVAFYGTNTTVLEKYINDFNSQNTAYRAELRQYDPSQSGTEAAMNSLLVDLASDNAPDVLFANRAISGTSGFLDLTPFLDSDAALSRDGFLPGLLPALEQNGKLYQLWDGFNVLALCAYDAADYEHLTLGEVNAAVAAQNGETALFSPFTDRYGFLSSVLPGAVSRCADEKEGTVDFDTPEMREILSICAALPAEPDFRDERAYALEPLALACADAFAYAYPEPDAQGIRFFSLSDNADNYTALTCRTGGCMMLPAKGQNPQGAWDFISSVLSRDEQLAVTAALPAHIGFPVNTSALERELTKPADEEHADPALTDNQRAKLTALIENADVITASTADIVSIALDTAETLTAQGYTPDEIIPQLNSKLTIHLAERYN